ncbi:MAG: PEP-CTERM sorting domain-containing protein, partial [Alphaproteobacteria bacterium]
TYSGGRRTLTADDITGIQKIYGVPEPAALGLMLVGLLGFGWARRRGTGQGRYFLGKPPGLGSEAKVPS